MIGQFFPSAADVTAMQLVVVVGAASIAAVWDYRTRRIPNVLTIPLLATGVTWFAMQHGLSGAGNSMAAAFLLALPYIVLFLTVGGGGGDFKLMAGIGAWVGIVPGLFFLFCVAICGVVFALVLSFWQRRLRETLRQVGLESVLMLHRVKSPALALSQTNIEDGEGARKDSRTSEDGLALHSPSQTMPYGVAIFAGVCLAAGGILL